MHAKQESCCFTGHRPDKLPWGRDESDPRCLELKRRMTAAVREAWEAGYRHFLCGMARGCDLYFGEIVAALREELDGVTLEAAIPCPEQADRWSPGTRERYAALLEQCDTQTVLSPHYTPDCMQRRNRYMVDHSSLLIAAYDGTSGGTRYTLEYALRRGLQISNLHVEEIW